MPLTDFWRFFLGASIIALVLIFPRGLGGVFTQFFERQFPKDYFTLRTLTHLSD